MLLFFHHRSKLNLKNMFCLTMNLPSFSKSWKVSWYTINYKSHNEIHKSFMKNIGKVIRAKWPIKPELIPVSVA